MDALARKAWLVATAQAAHDGGATWSEYAASEAALESNYGQSLLAIVDKNLFGTKQHKHPIYGTHNIPTKEFLGGEWVIENAAWVSYPDLKACFDDRMETLARLRRMYPHYHAALVATDGRTFIKEVSQSWSTDPNRGDKVLQIYDTFFS